MTMYRLTQGRRVHGHVKHDWYSGELEHLTTYGNAREAKRHIRHADPDGSIEWPEVYDQRGNRLTLADGRLVKAGHTRPLS